MCFGCIFLSLNLIHVLRKSVTFAVQGCFDRIVCKTLQWQALKYLLSPKTFWRTLSWTKIITMSRWEQVLNLLTSNAWCFSGTVNPLNTCLVLKCYTSKRRNDPVLATFCFHRFELLLKETFAPREQMLSFMSSPRRFMSVILTLWKQPTAFKSSLPLENDASFNRCTHFLQVKTK